MDLRTFILVFLVGRVIATLKAASDDSPRRDFETPDQPGSPKSPHSSKLFVLPRRRSLGPLVPPGSFLHPHVLSHTPSGPPSPQPDHKPCPPLPPRHKAHYPPTPPPHSNPLPPHHHHDSSKCGNRKRVVPFLRPDSSSSSLGSHLIGFIFPSSEPHTIPFFAFYDSEKRDWFYTANRQEAKNAVEIGYNPRGIAGWIPTDPYCGSVPLYRLYYAMLDDHFYTTSLKEAKDAMKMGWSNDGSIGYVFK